MFKKILLLIFFLLASGYWLFTRAPERDRELRFTISPNETATELAAELKTKKVIFSPKAFLSYLKFKNLDTSLQTGDYVVVPPINFNKIVFALKNPGVGERTITVIPGWTLRDLADYLVNEKIANSKEEVYALTGVPAELSEVNLRNLDQYKFLQTKSARVSLEGYFRPDTYRIYKSATLEDVLNRLLNERTKQISDEWYNEIARQGKTWPEIFTLASILQKEVRASVDKKIVADIFWRRLKKNWALQADSTVHYIFGLSDSVYTTAKQRASQNLYNTYKYPGLPPGPISLPSLESIEAVLYPTPNDYWYFLTTPSGEVKYAKTLDEHIKNKRFLD